MTAVEFLREKGILKEPYNEWVINFHNGIRVDIVKLMEEFVTMEKQKEISDEEIEKAAEEWEPTNKSPAPLIKMGFRNGAKWYRKQLKQRK